MYIYIDMYTYSETRWNNEHSWSLIKPIVVTVWMWYLLTPWVCDLSFFININLCWFGLMILCIIHQIDSVKHLRQRQAGISYFKKILHSFFWLRVWCLLYEPLKERVMILRFFLPGFWREETHYIIEIFI